MNTEVSNQTSGTRKRAKHPGIRVRHSTFCPAYDDSGARCSAGRKDGCEPRYEAWVYLKAEEQKVRKSFTTLRAAKDWREDAVSAAKKRKLRAPTQKTLREAADEWVTGAQSGAVLTKGSRRYKPSMIREVERSLKLHALPDLGARRLSDISRADVQALIDRLSASGLSGSRVRGVVTAFKMVLRRPLMQNLLTEDPTHLLLLPAPAGTRDRVVSLEEGERLIAALPESERALWATALYAGLRRGELRALRWSDVNLASGVIRISRSMDDKEGVIAPKSERGVRETPMFPALIDYLSEHKVRTGRGGDELVFGSRSGKPFTSTNVYRKAAAGWDHANAEEARKAEADDRDPVLLVPVRLHELRHSWVSLLADAGFTLEEAAVFAGHSAVSMTERYKHVFPGTAERAARRLVNKAAERMAQTTEAIDELRAET